MQALSRILAIGPLLFMLGASVGCQTLSSVGIPVGSGQFMLNSSASRISQTHGQPVAVPRELDAAALGVYIVEPGDVLYLEPAKFDSEMRLPADQPVQPDGAIDVGRYGRVHVAGYTLEQVRGAVQAAIATADGAEADAVVVRLIDWKSKVFYVMGEVNSPGAYPYTGNENVLDAILAAGDITSRANKHQIILSRPTGPCQQRVVLPVCYDNIVQLGDTTSNFQLRPGDRIFVAGISLVDDILQSLVPMCVEQCPTCGPAQVGQPMAKIICGTPSRVGGPCPTR